MANELIARNLDAQDHELCGSILPASSYGNPAKFEEVSCEKFDCNGKGIGFVRSGIIELRLNGTDVGNSPKALMHLHSVLHPPKPQPKAESDEEALSAEETPDESATEETAKKSSHRWGKPKK